MWKVSAQKQNTFNTSNSYNHKRQMKSEYFSDQNRWTMTIAKFNSVQSCIFLPRALVLLLFLFTLDEPQ